MESITKTFLDVLTELYVADPSATECIIKNKVTVNEQAVNTRVICTESSTKGLYQLGALGLLNSILESINGDKIAAVYNVSDNTFVGFQVFGNPKAEGDKND